ncbi:MAG TPA: hypothetical protein VF885_16520 [Arthrobacter sp.]
MTEMARDPARRPLDTFDSTADGFPPHTLEQTLQAARDVVEALERFDAALKGCSTPLELVRLAGQGRSARAKAEVWVEELSEARDIIELDLPISDTWNREGGPLTLPPASIVRRHGEAASLPLGRLTSYRREIEKRDLPVPPFISRHRDRERHRAWRATLTDDEYKAVKSEGRGALARSYREFGLHAGSAGPDLVEGVAIRVDREANLAGNE